MQTKKTLQKEESGQNQKKFCLNVSEDCALQEFLESKLAGYSRSKIKSLISHRLLTLADGTLLARHDAMLKKGQVVEVHSYRSKAGRVLEHPKLKILFEDEHIIVVEKKEGLLSVRSPRQLEESASHLLNRYVNEGRRDNAHIFVVHRLDKETSGVMMFAKDKQTQIALRDNWRNAVKKRAYIAVVSGKMEDASGTVKSYLTEDVRQKMHSSPVDNGGQLAITHYKTLKTGDKYSLLELNLETGRKNQIRVQMQSIGHPVAGDIKYGAGSCFANRLCLHAESLVFVHPYTKETLTFEIPYPEIFNRMVN